MKEPMSISDQEVEENLMPQKALKKYTRGVKISFGSIVLFASFILLFWIARMGYIFTWLKGYDDISDLINVMSIVLLFLIIISGIGMIVSNTASKDKRIITIISCILLAGIHIWLLQTSSKCCYQVVSTTSIISKEIEEKGQCFIINNKNYQGTVKIECDEETYDTLISDENVLYTMTYRTISINTRWGILRSIDTQGIVDNRR